MLSRHSNVYWHPDASDQPLELPEANPSSHNSVVMIDSCHAEAIITAYSQLHLPLLRVEQKTTVAESKFADLDEMKAAAIAKMNQINSEPEENTTTYKIASCEGFFVDQDGKDYYQGVIATTIFMNHFHFTYVSCTKPQLLSKDEMNQSDLYSIAMKKTLRRLHNVHPHNLTPLAHKINTVILFGTFDLFHDLHKRLIHHAFDIGKRVVIYVNHRDKKTKQPEQRDGHKNQIKLTHAAAERIEHVAEYAIAQCPQNSEVLVRRMTGKHINNLKRAIKEFSQQGESVAVFGGEDQFSVFYEMLDTCFLYKTPIYTINRGDEGKKLCSSDLRMKQSYQRIADSYGVELSHVSPTLFKVPPKQLKSYAEGLPFFGNDSAAELWKYNPEFSFDTRIFSPAKYQGKLVICLPGRTKCDRDRARKIFRTLKNSLPESTHPTQYFLLAYKEDGKRTGYYVNHLEKEPYGYFSHDAMLVVKHILMPLISDNLHIYKNNEIWFLKKPASFAKVPVQQLNEVFSQVTFTGRSRGSVMTLEIENAFIFCLRQLNYTNAEIVEIGKHICVYCVSGLSSLERDRLFTTYTAVGVNDKQAQKYIKNHAAFTHLHHEEKSCTAKLFSATHLTVFAKIPDTIKTGMDSNGNKDPNAVMVDPDHHYTPFYISPRVDGDNTFPDLNNETFAEMVNRQIDFNIKQLRSDFVAAIGK